MQTKAKLMLRTTLIMSLLAVVMTAFANSGPSSLFSLMEQKKFDQVIISTDFNQFLDNKTKGSSQEARMLLRNENGELEKLTVEISARGKYRLMNCSAMPPIRIKVASETQKEKGFQKNYQKFKLVTHCVEDNDQAVLKEYWAYKMFSELTPNSFRVHLMQVVYHNTATNKREKHMAFLIEDTDEMADRIGGEEKDVWGMEANEMNAASYQDFVLFQHLIGNPDWDIASTRNVKFVYVKGQKKPIIVPYDFDYASIVEAPYIPQYGKLGSFKAQLESGIAGDTEAFNQLCQKIDRLNQKSWVFEDCEFLSSQSKREMKTHLNFALGKITRAKKSIEY